MSVDGSGSFCAALVAAGSCSGGGGRKTSGLLAGATAGDDDASQSVDERKEGDSDGPARVAAVLGVALGREDRDRALGGRGLGV